MVMQALRNQDFPALYRSADALSLRSQKQFYNVLRADLFCLLIAAILSLFSTKHWGVAATQVVVLLAALGCSAYLFGKRPDKHWYAGRAVAESVKTCTWRYIMRAEPFDTSNELSRREFRAKLKAIHEQNEDTVRALTDSLDSPQISSAMESARALTLTERIEVYDRLRIGEQRSWYAGKASFNNNRATLFFWLLIGTNSIAVILAVLRIQFFSSPHWPTDIFVALAACLLSWMQAKKYSELSASYALTANEIGIIHEEIREIRTEIRFSNFIGDAENAFSREHTQWIARKDT